MKIYEVKQTTTTVQVKYVIANNENEAVRMSRDEDWKEKEQVVDAWFEATVANGTVFLKDGKLINLIA